MTTIPAIAERPTTMPVIERFLRDRNDVWHQIAGGRNLGKLIEQMLISSTISLALYGGVVGLSSSPLQALASAIKLPILFLLTLLICLPTLYLFNLLRGGQLSALQTLALALTAITVTSAMTLAFAPVTLFFLITARSYAFFVLLNVAVLALTGAVGLSFMAGGVKALNTLATLAPPPFEPDAPKPARAAGLMDSQLLQIWLLLYAFVGTQLGWTLRPFFGTPGAEFVLFRMLESNFYESVVRLLFALVR